MIQITFQAALDPSHTVFRFFRLRAAIENKIAFDKLKILDFYLQFPFRLGEMKFFQRHTFIRKLAAKYEAVKPYGNLPDSHILFDRMKPIQSAAFQSMVVKGYYDREAYDQGLAASTEKGPPKEIEARIIELNTNQVELIKCLVILSEEYALTGADGLKARSNLLEYRYDAL